MAGTSIVRCPPHLELGTIILDTHKLSGPNLTESKRSPVWLNHDRRDRIDGERRPRRVSVPRNKASTKAGGERVDRGRSCDCISVRRAVVDVVVKWRTETFCTCASLVLCGIVGIDRRKRECLRLRGDSHQLIAARALLPIGIAYFPPGGRSQE